MKISFKSTPIQIGNMAIIRIPKDVSEQFSSRGLVLAQVKHKDKIIVLPLEPDGYGGHWLDGSDLIFNNMGKDSGLTYDLPLEFEIDTDVEWPRPELPEDFRLILEEHGLLETWTGLTVKAQWEWLRWVRSTANSDTRMKRLNTACDKLMKGMKRPCCYDQTRCSVPEVSKNGRLL